MRPLGHATVAGFAGLVTSAVLVAPGWIGVFLPPLAWGAVLCVVWIGQSVVLAMLERAVGVLPPQAGWLAALGAAGAALLTALGPFLSGSSRYSWTEVAVVDAVALAALVLAVRLSAAWLVEPGDRPAAFIGWPVPVVALVLGLLTAAALLDLAREPAVPSAAGQTPSHSPPAAPTGPAPAATPAPTFPEPVQATVPCAQQDLSFAVVGFDGAMGARAATLRATNGGAAPCWLEGTPVVVVMQGGRPLSLSVGPGQTAGGAPAVAQRVGLAPGGTAVALLSWRSYGGWADLETPQSVATALDANSSLVSAEVAASGPAPFDLADGGAWAIAPWAPPWN